MPAGLGSVFFGLRLWATNRRPPDLLILPQVVLEDNLIYRKFEQWCWADWDEYKQHYLDCYADEVRL